MNPFHFYHVPNVPEGTRIALAPGSYGVSNPWPLWDALDEIHAKHPDMVLLHGDGFYLARGADYLATSWTSMNDVNHIPFEGSCYGARSRPLPDPRNKVMLELLPICILACPGTGITENFTDRARHLGIPIISPYT